MTRRVTFDTYDRLISDRPFKLSPEEVNYTKAKGTERCEYCVHFYNRVVDDWKVCEILRDIKDDDNEYPIKPDFRCDFFTTDNETFPLLGDE